MVRRLSSLAFVVGLFVLMVPGAAAGGGCHVPPDLAMKSSTVTDVAIGECAFRDTVTYVDPGESVTWFNKDPVPHTVSGALGSWGDEKFLSRGDRVTYKFDEEGVFPYYCALHPAMVGAVVVGGGKPPVGTASGGGVEKIDLAAAVSSDDEPVRDSGSSSAWALAGAVGVIAACVAVWRLTATRRAQRAEAV